MKGFLLSVLLACLALSLAALDPNYHISLGFDFPGSQDLSSTKLDTDPGISPSFELLFTAAPRLKLGGGVEYQILRGFHEGFYGGEPKYQFIPLYATGRFNVIEFGGANLEVLLDLGYNFLSGKEGYFSDVSGGMYFAAGIGVQSANGFTFDVRYRSHGGGYETHNYERSAISKDITQTNFSVRLGLMF